MFAHGLGAASLQHWDLHPLVVVPLFATAVLYAAGVVRLWSRAGAGRGLSRWTVASFAAGWSILAIALVSPIAWLSGILFSVHMTQHTLLMLVAAPLLAFGQPLLAWLWACDAPRRDAIATACRRPAWSAAWGIMTAPAAVFLIQAAVLWGWHIPELHEAALHSDAVHALQHVTMTGAAAAFWWAMVRGRYGRMGYGMAVLYVFLTAVHSGGLGALLTFAPQPWFAAYARRGAPWGVDSLGDQQLAGLLMWIPAGSIFIVLGLALFAAWLGETERRVRFGATDAAAR